jgi:hypothetical protein
VSGGEAEGEGGEGFYIARSGRRADLLGLWGKGLRPALSHTGRPDEEPRNGPTGSKPGPIQNEELASSVPVSGPPSPRSWHESIPQWVVALQTSPQQFIAK